MVQVSKNPESTIRTATRGLGIRLFEHRLESNDHFAWIGDFHDHFLYTARDRATR